MNDKQIIESICKQIIQEIPSYFKYTESNYQTLLRKRLTLSGFQVLQEVEVYWRTADNLKFGRGYIDLLIETKDTVFIIEIKVFNSSWAKGSKQVQRYLRHFQTHKFLVGLLVCYNCGGREFRISDVKRIVINTSVPKYVSRYPDVMNRSSNMEKYVTNTPHFQEYDDISMLPSVITTVYPPSLPPMDIDSSESNTNSRENSTESDSNSL